MGKVGDIVGISTAYGSSCVVPGRILKENNDWVTVQLSDGKKFTASSGRIRRLNLSDASWFQEEEKRMKLSDAQQKVLKRASSTSIPFQGHQFKTIESLANKGLLKFNARLQCRTCGDFECQRHRGGTRWVIWAEITQSGKEWLRNHKC